MNRTAFAIAGAMTCLAVASAALAQQQSGAVGSGPPEDVSLEVTVGPEGPSLSQSEFRLAHGGYYRFNLVCPTDVENEAGISFHAPELMENVHIRIVSVADPDSDDEINFHMQGLNFRSIDCEGLGASARFSFHPMRAGTYPFTVTDSAEPPNEASGEVIVE
ncbi:hypothetical protein [Roseitranquillus sediminis]|uniref:hypothetical protein n=1 Tax=Roseitranquillus sediminis TaxID=2809051 RepID=UPI001D0C409B|nr:hypothetical protein [Roseitranquillus sediminis]MBM9596157.1 hypothetical protein [Roseitranquillus sediminis]